VEEWGLDGGGKDIALLARANEPVGFQGFLYTEVLLAFILESVEKARDRKRKG
jgi:hypothetical protein